MIMLAGGNTLQEMPRDLSLSPGAVSTYRSRLNAMMNTCTDQELTDYVIQRDLL